MHLDAQIISVAELSPVQRDRMFALMARHFDGMSRERFERDLAEKNWAIVLNDPATRQLAGFSTQMLFDADVAGRSVRALFSGDTIVDRAYWGDNTLAHIWGQFALTLVDQFSALELYWLLISKGYRTYRYLPLFFREFYPRFDRPTPLCVQNVLDSLVRAKYPDSYDAAAGVIRADGSGERLRAELAEIPSRRGDDPHVRFFSTRNPGYVRGEELCCLAPLSRDNFTRAALRVIEREPART
jgi:hypothetical protein